MFTSPFHPVIMNVGVHARVIKRQRLNTTMHDEYERITGEVVHNLTTHTHTSSTVKLCGLEVCKVSSYP